MKHRLLTAGYWLVLIIVSLITHTSVPAAEINASKEPAERLIWRKRPLTITLPVGVERLLTFPGEVRVGLPDHLTANIRAQSHQGTIYWLAHKAFSKTRIQVQHIDSGRIVLIDLSAKKDPSISQAPIEVVMENLASPTNNKRSTQIASQNPYQRPHYSFVTLTRFMAQQLYAPERLLKKPPGIHRSPVKQSPIQHLYRHHRLEITPIAAWRSGEYHATALKIENLDQQTIDLDPRQLRGQWLTATFQHNRLLAKGQDGDTSALYLISNRPFEEAR